MRRNTRQIGNYGELLAEDFLRKKKYKILERNFYTPLGEIDIVAKEKKQLVFIEVKMNQVRRFGLPEEKFNFYKKQKLFRAIKAYFLENQFKGDNWRLDLVAIEMMKENEKPIIRHYQGITLT